MNTRMMLGWVTLVLVGLAVGWGSWEPGRAVLWGQEPRAAATAPGTDLIYGPFVTAVSPEGARVDWVSPAKVEGTCQVTQEAGVAVTYEAAPWPKRTELRHTAVLTGLKADSRHRYVVTAARDQAEGVFRTPPATGAQARFSFAITGDTQTFPPRIRMIADAMAKEAPAFVIHTGDLTDDGQNWSLWEAHFFGPWRDLLRLAPVWPVRGNHEKGAEPFGTLFGLPAEREWYSFDYANLHVVVLDQWDLPADGPMEPERMTEMAAWLDKDLTAAQGKAEWILVAGHQPMFNVAGHGSTWGHEAILPLLYKHGVDLVVSGHSHLYERFVPIGPAGAKPIQFLVAGGGGGPNYPSSPSPLLAKTHVGLHYCLYTVDGPRLEWKVKGPDGALLDDVVLTHEGGALPRAVMAAAVPPEDALRLLKVFKILSADVTEKPQAGHTLAVSFPAGRFPLGSKVKLSADPAGLWGVTETSFEVKEGETAVVQVLPPAHVLLDEGQNFAPKLTLAVELDYHGRHWANPSVPVALAEASLRHLVPAADVVLVPPAPRPIVVDGDLAEWKDVPFVRLPLAQGLSRRVKLAWSKEALYGAVEATEAEIHADKNLPWNGDGLEINVEADVQQRLRMNPWRGVPLKLYLLPDAEKGDGEAWVRRMMGHLARGSVQAAWRKTATGYTLEFSLSAKGLTPATEKDGTVVEAPEIPLAAGRTIGLDWILRRDGETVERFADTKPFRAAGGTPPYWGQVKLADK